MPRRGTSRARRRTRNRRRRSRGPDLALLGKRGFQGLAAAVALAIGLTQLVDWLEGRGDSESALVASLEDFNVREGQVLRNFLRLTQVSAQVYAGEDRDQRGTGMDARLRARGAERTSLHIRWTLIDAATGRRVPGNRWSRIFESVYLVDVLDERVFCWVPPPPRPGVYLVVLTVETPDGHVWERVRTRQFRASDALRR